MAVAVNVLNGSADTGLGVYSAARALGLDFVPLARERYDLVIPAKLCRRPPDKALLALLQKPDLQGRHRGPRRV